MTHEWHLPVKPVLIGMVVDCVMFSMCVNVRKMTFDITMAVALFVPRLRIVVVSGVIAELVRFVTMQPLLVIL